MYFHGNAFSIYYITDSDIYVSTKKETHCCVFIARMVMQTCHNVMSYVQYLVVLGAINIKELRTMWPNTDEN
jgi:hypothetical protein